MQRAVTLFEGIWFFVRRSRHNSCAAAFDRYRTGGSDGVLIYVYTVESLKNEKKTEILLAFQLLTVWVSAAACPNACNLEPF
jgi:hypothetical protein